MSNTALFYRDLPAYDQFEQIMQEQHYTALPDDWYLIIVDINGSTKAIEEGRYKDVNMIGASAIIAVLNQTDKKLIPYVFGGDGASFAIPPEYLKDVCAALYGVRKVSEGSFDLPLRIGVMPVKKLYDQNLDVSVCKFQAAPGIHLAMFSGGGIETAENIIKSNSESSKYDVTQYCDIEYMENNSPSFEGLECRWNPVKSQNGEHITLMVSARGANKHDIYQDVYSKISKIFHKDDGRTPINEDKLMLSNSQEQLGKEALIKSTKGDAASHLRKINWVQRIGRFLLQTGIKAKGFSGKTYKKQLIQNSDYRKFDDMLRIILDSNETQKHALISYLESQYEKQNIYYGIHISDTVLLTCLVFDYQDYHVHFVDGGNGGYAMAAKQLKAQLKQNQQQPAA